MKIKAECHADDQVLRATFDATPWFEQASCEDIGKLAACDWGGDYPADEVAQFMAEQDGEVRKMFQYLDIVGNLGFECHVDRDDAIAWLRMFRHAVAALIESEDGG